METKIFLEGFNSKKSVSTDEGLNVGLRGKRRLLPTNDVAEVISQFDQYQEEREACNIIRLTCQVNPICTNVLFNRVSEIVKDEGSSAVTYVNYNVTPTSNQDRNVDYGEDDGKLRYKSRELSFWSGGTFNYQSTDEDISNLTIEDSLQDAIVSTNYNIDRVVESTVQHPTNSIRDMQLSHCGYVYHCGLDIFNNHLIRSKTFKCVCKMPSEYDARYGAFNTIADLMRDVNGLKVAEKITYPIGSGIFSNGAADMKFVALHLYKYDDICAFDECVRKRLIDTFNGWVGFDNKPKIKTYEIFSIDHMSQQTNGEVEEELHIERPLMYMNGGDFVDMYPDRSLYSFVPKFNHFRNRIEKNWNYCLTYPSSSTTDGFEDIIEASNSSLKAIYFNENTKSDNGITQLVIYSIAKHGLNVGDTINIYKTYKDGDDTVTVKIIDNAEVKELADEYVFTVFNADTQISKEWAEITMDDFRNGYVTINGIRYDISGDRKTCTNSTNSNVYYIINRRYVNIDDTAQHISYKKVVNDIECEYYVRIFSKIPNFKNASVDTSNEYQIYKDDAEVLHAYQDKKYNFESHVSRLAFAKNIYTDEVGEVVFTDDINIANLHDNLGRPLSSIYLTIIKNNKGYKEWYGYDYSTDWDVKQITADTVEYSHCFGKITCGLETSYESTCNSAITSIYTMSNDPNESGNFGYNVENINGGHRTYNNCTIGENEIWFDFDKHYYGDLCYYDNYNAVERSIQPFMHRFNTAQRESSMSASNNYYNNFVYDEIGSDDYDASGDFTISATTVKNANQYNEGYYYNPHYEIRLRTFDKIQTVFPDFLTIKSLYKVSENTYRITCLENHYLTLGDKSIIYDRDKRQYYYCTTVSDEENDTYRTFTCKIWDEKGNAVDIDPMYGGDENLRNYRLFKMDNLDAPSYATVLKDGSCRVIYRDILNNGFNISDDTVEEYPFTNGAFYVNKRVDLFVRRQDPHGWYGLRKDDLKGKEIESENDNYVKDKDIVC